MRPMKVSVIMTVLNEGESIHAALDSLAAQTRPPDEVVIADGGSRDSTLAIIIEYDRAGRLPLKVIEVPGANIAEGRNAAIRAAHGEIVVSTDAGVRCEPDWLEKITAPFVAPLSRDSQAGTGEGPGVRAVAGFFRSDPQTVFETALGATTLPEARDVNPQTYLPSSRSVAFRKSAWEAVGGYPEWLDYCEDVIFDLKLREKYGPFVFVPEAVVHFRPRPNLRALFRQYHRYARGDGKANLFPRQHAIRYLTYLVVAPLLAYAAITVSPWLWLIGVFAGLAYVRLPLRRLWPRLKELSLSDQLKALADVLVIRVAGDVAKMVGYPAGVVWRVKTRGRGGDYSKTSSI
jgi:glycosyltransferase involved in cell wall biosynthesis